MSSIAVLYGTTADDNVRPVLCNDSGQLVTDQSGGTNWYENLYVGGSEGNPSISLLSDGSITAANDRIKLGITYIADPGNSRGILFGSDSVLPCDGEGVLSDGSYDLGGDPNRFKKGWFSDDVITTGDVYCNKLHQADGYDLSKIGQALTTIHDVVESVDDLQGLKNLFHLLLDNLKSDPTPPTPPTPEPPE